MSRPNVIRSRAAAADLQGNPHVRSISDDDLCASCARLAYCPGEMSVCRLAADGAPWPASWDADGYAIACPSFEAFA